MKTKLLKKPEAKKPRFTPKEDRQAGHVADSEIERGVPEKEAKSIGFATVNKQKGRRKK